MKKTLRRFYIGLIFLFMYSPIFVLIAYSFNESKNRMTFTGFTLEWYVKLFQDEKIMSALLNTLIIAALSSVIATVIGTAAAIGISNMRKTPRNIVMNISYMQIVNPEIVTGISLMLLFVFLKNNIGMELGFVTVLLAHITFNLPYVILNVMPKLRQLNPNIYEAAQDLGCSPRRAFFKVVIPEIMPGILSGFLMAFTLSFDDFVISYFTNGSSFETLPITIYTMTKKRIPLTINALSAILFIVVLAALILINIKDIKNAKNNK